MATNTSGDQETPDQTRKEKPNAEISPQIEEIDVALAGESDRFVAKFPSFILIKFFSLAGKPMMKAIFMQNR